MTYWDDDPKDERPQASTCLGIMLGLLLSLPFWAIVAVIAYRMSR